MPSTKEIRTRIKSVKNTAQITRAMQLVAASKMKKAQETAIAGRAYALMLAELLASVADDERAQNHPFLQKREVKKRGILLITTDKGLCGGLNANLLRLATQQIQDDAAYISVGRKGTQFISRTKRPLTANFSISDQVTYAETRAITEFLIKQFLDGEIDTIEVAYNRFVNTLAQEPVVLKLLPVGNILDKLDEIKQKFHIDLKDTQSDERDFIFEPSAGEILDELPELFVKQEIYQILLEAKASEHSARMVAMKAATDNAKNLVDDLTLEYNKARQAAITQEILEIAAATQFN